MANAVVLLQDDFNGAFVDATRWQPAIGDVAISGGYANLNFHVDHQANGTNAFRDAGLWGQSTFAIPSGASGLEYSARMRIVGAPPKGLVGAFYSISNPGGSEIDFELLTNGYSASADDKIWLNTWRSGSQSSEYPTLAGYDMTAWNTYTIRWKSNEVKWFINGTQVRDYDPGWLSNYVPNQPMRVDMSYWKAQSGWGTAYNSQLNNAAASATYVSQVDWVDVRTVGETAAYPVQESGRRSIVSESFESLALADAGYTVLNASPIPGWQPQAADWGGLYNPHNGDFAGSSAGYGPLPTPAAGSQCLYMTVDSRLPSWAMTSDNLELAQAGTTYTLDVAVGERLGMAMGSFTIQLLRAGSIVASNTLYGTSLTGGTFQDLSLSYSILPNDTVGGYLQIALLAGWVNDGSGAAQQVQVDHIRLNAAAMVVPEPSTIVLLAMGLMGLAVYAWRKRS